MTPGPTGDATLPEVAGATPPGHATLTTLDRATAALVRLSARITAGSEQEVREGFAECAAAAVDPVWIEELVLQSYLFAGFPRALNAAREWGRGETVRGEGRGSGVKGRSEGEGRGERESSYAEVDEWRRRGEETCAIVYGEMYEKLRGNIRALHPELDEWMIVEGYGKVLSREGLDLARRELCIVAACVAARQDRQLHSHLHGARNTGVAASVVDATLVAIGDVVPEGALVTATLLWNRVRGK